MADDSGDKTEEPTAKRIADARKKGQIPRSKELNTFVALMTGSVMLMFTGESICKGLIQIIRKQFKLKRDVFFDDASLVIYFKQVLLDGMLLIVPLVLAMGIVALLTPIMMGGWNFSTDSMSPKISKMNPVSGLKRMFGVQGWVELLKSIVKIVLVFSVAGSLFKGYLDQFMALSSLSLNNAMINASDIILFGFLILSSTLIVIVAIDVPYQLWNNNKQLKMSKQEVKDESKQQEGNPEIKGQIRRKQMEMSQQRMMDEVPKADVIVTNPTHYAIALKYDPLGSGAPVMVAKGVDLIAAQIRNSAMGADVPLVAAPPLARALFYSAELGEEIPKGLFLAVAQILAYVFQLKAATENNGEKPFPPRDIKVPDDFRQE
ncbi:MAG: flagellar biosynthesis protein FlhB [Methylococcaceae bacterium]|nr:flagellar biosynthesis protein FlhB [Methylococcaceae bacterium]